MQENGIIIFPTDTIYGIGCRLDDKEALANIYKLKARDLSKQLPIMLPDLVSINQIAKFNDRDYKIMRSFWPGQITVILNTTDDFYRKTGYQTVAVRIPNHELALSLLKEYGPMWVTSANISTKGATNDLTIIKNAFAGKVAKIYEEEGLDLNNKPSTIVDLTKSDKIKILRPGAINLAAIKRVLG